MHDTLEYFQTPPSKRSEIYHKLTFSMMYFYGERYLLPFSHDEVVHGKATISQKMCGQYGEKFPQARAMYLYMAVHPGKKMNFMGNEIRQLREWDEKREQDWDMRKYPAHDSFYRFISELNHIYLTHPALYERDYNENGFSWLDCHQEEKSVYAILRYGKDERLIAVFNFSDKKQEYALAGHKAEKLLIHTDWEKYGGKTAETSAVLIKSAAGTEMTLPPFSGIILSLAG